jgi:fumarylacetoacetate (FAA) hydrolase
MKLATLKTGTRDGALVVVDRAMTRFTRAEGIAATMQQAIETWAEVEPRLRTLAQALEAGAVEGETFDPLRMMAPLPRAYHWVDGGGYMPHMTLMRQSRNAPMPDNWKSEPLFVQGNADRFWASRDPILLAQDEGWGVDLEGELAVILDDVPMRTSAADARRHIKLMMLMNDVSLRDLIPAELSKGFGFYQSKPNKAFAPVAVTLDELGDAWDGGRAHIPITVHINGQWFGHPNAGTDFQFSFPEVIEHATKTRLMGAGTILGSGTVSNWDRSLGHCCINEKRALETVETGAPLTPYMRFGDVVRIEAFDREGQSIFGAIEQRVTCYAPEVAR